LPATDLVARAAAASTSHAALPLWLPWAALLVVVVVRLLWFLDYLRLGRHDLAGAFTLLTSSMYTATTEPERQKNHEDAGTETDRLVDICLLAGTIAFAAWTALFAVANQTPGSEISSTTRSVLLVGAIALVAAPMVFRVPDRHTTYIGRRSFLFIGLTAVGLAFAWLAEDLLGKVPGAVVALAAVAILVVRDVLDTVGEITLQRDTVRPALAAQRAMRAAAEQEAQAAAQRANEEGRTPVAAASGPAAGPSPHEAAAQQTVAPEAGADTARRDAEAADEAAKGDAT
jgi:hypothetical protein